jgi:PAS domain S-box-containing protein
MTQRQPEALRNNSAGLPDKYRSLLESVDGIVWEADADTLEFTFVSDSLLHILGYTSFQWLSDKNFWLSCVYHEDRDKVSKNYKHQASLPGNSLDFRMVRPDGTIVWVRNIISKVHGSDQPASLCGIMVNITENKQLNELDLLEKQALELNLQHDTTIKAVLEFYSRGLETFFPNMKCSVLRVSDGRLFNWAADSLPDAYIAHIDGLTIGPRAGSCGSAAYFRERVIVADIAHDDKWIDYRDVALQHDLRACWSSPVINANGEVIAVLGMYYNKVQSPNRIELEVIERSASILNVLIENNLYAAMLHETNMLITQGQELANFGTWQWDIKRDTVRWSDILYKIYGLDERTFKATFDGYLNLLHPEDRDRVALTITSTLTALGDVTFEERIIRPDGSVRHLRSWGRVVVDNRGEAVKMIGACLDVTAMKTAEHRMQEIAWQQSHVVRAPLARVMGLVHILKDNTYNKQEQKELYDAILASADELDQVIRAISRQAENSRHSA